MAPLILLIFVAAFIGLGSCQLEAVKCQARLPIPVAHTQSVYNGADHIYIFGGFRDATGGTNTILQYSISTDSISPVASFPSSKWGGRAVADVSGDIFYFGGDGGPSTNVYKFTPSTGNLTGVSPLDSGFAFGALATHSNIAYLIGGCWSCGIQHTHCYNMSTMTNCGQTELPNGSDFRFSSAFSYKNKAFVFARYSGSNILILDLESLEFTVEQTTLPHFSNEEPAVVTDGRYGYLLGGYFNTTQTPSDALIKFDPETLTHEFISVRNYPGVELEAGWFYAASTVYVEKLNRIYIFGGLSKPFYHNEIWYIDLTPEFGTTTIKTTTTLNPDICDGKPDGMHPHPSDCSMYIGCFNGEMTIFYCPEPLLFNPEVGTCDLPDHVDCENSINDK